MDIRFHALIPTSYVDGPGMRSVLFLQGCSIRCPGCQNRHLWPANAGLVATVDQVAAQLVMCAESHGQVTISGGEPFDQPQALAELVKRLRSYGIINITVYTGYTWEQLHSSDHPANPWVGEVLAHIDILVDGPFQATQDNDAIVWRGSANQRPIDVAASLAAGRPVVLDWNNTLQIDASGNLVLPLAFAEDFAAVGALVSSRRCGQTR